MISFASRTLKQVKKKALKEGLMIACRGDGVCRTWDIRSYYKATGHYPPATARLLSRRMDKCHCTRENWVSVGAGVSRMRGLQRMRQIAV